MDNSIWIILFHTIMDRKPVGILADLTLTVGKSSRVQDKSIRIHAEQDLVGLLEELSDAENKNLEKVLWESKIVLSVHYELFDEVRDIPTIFYESLSKADLIAKYAKEINGFVDCLYQTLPPLRRVQEIRFSSLSPRLPRLSRPSNLSKEFSNLARLARPAVELNQKLKTTTLPPIRLRKP